MRHRPPALVCDPDTQAAAALRAVLEHGGFRVQVALTAADALAYAAQRPFDVVITELVLPDHGGVDLFRELRESSGAAVIVLSSMSGERDKVRALDAGADDFLTKPLRPGELLARVNAILRRVSRDGHAMRRQVDGLTVDVATRVVWRDGEEVQLTSTELELLLALAGRRGRVVTYDELLAHASAPMSPRGLTTLQSHIYNLRRKLAAAQDSSLIHTHCGVGYRFEGTALT
jgi:DNA-binding response OmpR family regulator